MQLAVFPLRRMLAQPIQCFVKSAVAMSDSENLACTITKGRVTHTVLGDLPIFILHAIFFNPFLVL